MYNPYHGNIDSFEDNLEGIFDSLGKVVFAPAKLVSNVVKTVGSTIGGAVGGAKGAKLGAKIGGSLGGVAGVSVSMSADPLLIANRLLGSKNAPKGLNPALTAVSKLSKQISLGSKRKPFTKKVPKPLKTASKVATPGCPEPNLVRIALDNQFKKPLANMQKMLAKAALQREATSEHNHIVSNKEFKQQVLRKLQLLEACKCVQDDNRRGKVIRLIMGS
jgi:hypothetical protein